MNIMKGTVADKTSTAKQRPLCVKTEYARSRHVTLTNLPGSFSLKNLHPDLFFDKQPKRSQGVGAWLYRRYPSGPYPCSTHPG